MSYGLASLGLNVAAEEVQVFPSAAFSFSYGKASALVRPTITSANPAVSSITTSSKAYKNTKSINNSCYSSSSGNSVGTIYLTGICNPALSLSNTYCNPKAYLNSSGLVESSIYLNAEYSAIKFGVGELFTESLINSDILVSFFGYGACTAITSINANSSKRVKVKGLRPAKAFAYLASNYQTWIFAYGKHRVLKALATGTTYQAGIGKILLRSYLQAIPNKRLNLTESSISHSTLIGYGSSLRNIYQSINPIVFIHGDGDKISRGIRYVEFIAKSVSISLLVTGKLAITPYTGILARSYLDAVSNKIRNMYVLCRTSTSTYSESITIKSIKTLTHITTVETIEALPVHIKGAKGNAITNVNIMADGSILSTKSYGNLNTTSIVNNVDIVKIKSIGFNLNLSIFAISTGEAIQSNASIMAYATSFTTVLALPSINRCTSKPIPVVSLSSGLGIANIKYTKYFGSLNIVSHCLGISLKTISTSGTIKYTSECINTNYSVNNSSVFSNNLVGKAYINVEALKSLSGISTKLIKANIYGYANVVNTKVSDCHINSSSMLSDKAVKIVYCYGVVVTSFNLDANPLQESTITYSDLCNANATLSGSCNRIYKESSELSIGCIAIGDATNSTTKVNASLVYIASTLSEATKIVNASGSIISYLSITSDIVKILNAYSYAYLEVTLATTIEIQLKQFIEKRLYIESNPLCKINGYGNVLVSPLLRGIGYKNNISKAPIYRTYLVDEVARLMEIPFEVRTVEI